MNKILYRLGVCLSACLFSLSANAESPVPLVMDMTGTPAIGQDLTIAFKDGSVPVGTYFDIWICGQEAQGADRRPDDNLSDEENAGCTPLNFWFRAGLDPAPTAITFLMTDANYDAENEGFAKVDVRDPVTGDILQAVGSGENGDGGIPGADYCGRREPLLDRLGVRIEPPYYLITHDFEGGGHSNWFGPFDCPSQATAIPTNSHWGLIVLVSMLLALGLLLGRSRMV